MTEINTQYYFFDLDYTLIDTDSEWEWRAMLTNDDQKAEEQRQKHRYFLNLHHHGKLPLIEYTAFLMQDFKGKSTGEIANLALASFNKNIKKKVFKAAKETIAQIKKEKGKVIILSGSFKPIVEPIANYLDVDDIVSTELEIVDDTYTGKLVGEFCVLEGKVNKAKEYCALNNTTLATVSFYGDSHSDIPIMKQAGQATVVNPENSMKEIALKQGWNTVAWKV